LKSENRNIKSGDRDFLTKWIILVGKVTALVGALTLLVGAVAQAVH